MKPPFHLILAIVLMLSCRQVLLAQENLAELYYSGDYPEVIKGSSAIIASGDTSFNTFYLKALSEAQMGQSLEAIGTLQQALDIHPGERRLSRMLARQYFDAGSYVKAREVYTRLVTWDSTDVASWLHLAEIASFRQQFDQAIDALNRVLKTDSVNLSSLMMMGDILNRYNNGDAADFYERAYQLYPDNQKASYALGNWYIQAKEPEKTIPICEHMLEIDSLNIKFNKLLGYAYYKKGEPDQAVKWLDFTIALGDTTAFTFKFRGISNYLLADFIPAIEALENAVKQDSMDAEVHFFLGASLATIAEMEKAMHHLETSLRLMYPEPSVLSRIYSEQGNIKRLEMEYEAAYSLYEKAWETDSTNVISLYLMASILDNSLHQSKEALLDYQRYIDALDRLPEKKETRQGMSIRVIVEDRIITLKEELFFRDEQ